MRKLLATTMLLTAATATSATTSAQTAAVPSEISPGSGSLTDCNGNVWTINANNKILENGIPVLGGGDTAELTQSSCTIYGLSNGQNGSTSAWFTMSSVAASGDQYWTTSSAPPPGAESLTASPLTASQPSSASQAAAVPSAPATPPLVCGQAATTGAFHVTNGQIVGLDGNPWVGRGVDVHDVNLGAAAQLLPSEFPGVNLVRVDVTTYANPSTYAAAVSSLTARGTVVEFTDYTNSTGQDGGGYAGVVYTGAQLAAESAWYASMAAYFKNNPYVWLGTDNEPSATGGSLSQWQLATYQAIRGTGNTNPIFLEIYGWPGSWNSVMDPSVYAQMRNVIWDVHYYGWIADFSTDQTTVNQALAAEISAVQQTQSADGVVPVIIGEYGNSGTGYTVDQNGTQVLTAVINAGTESGIGSSAWVWDAFATVGGLPNVQADSLYSGGVLTTEGNAVALWINTSVIPCSQNQIVQWAQQSEGAATSAASRSPN